MNVKLRYFAPFVLALTAFAAGATAQETRVSAATTAAIAPINLKVQSIEGISNYKAPMVPPYAEHKFTVSPEKALIAWANYRLRALGGSQAVARFIITQAAVIHSKVPRESAVEVKWEPDQKADRYDATIEALLEVDDPLGGPRAITTAKVTRTVAMFDNVSDEVRRAHWQKLVADLINDFDAEMERQIRQHMTAWLM